MIDTAYYAKDVMMDKNMTKGLTELRVIAIVGGGYSGVMAAVNIMRELDQLVVTIYLIDKRAALGRGLAYSIWDDSMLLNVPAGNMSAYPDQPSDFLEYCRGLDPSLNAGSFVSRRIYGDYLEKVLAFEASRSSMNLVRIQSEAVSILENVLRIT